MWLFWYGKPSTHLCWKHRARVKRFGKLVCLGWFSHLQLFCIRKSELVQPDLLVLDITELKCNHLEYRSRFTPALMKCYLKKVAKLLHAHDSILFDEDSLKVRNFKKCLPSFLCRQRMVFMWPSGMNWTLNHRLNRLRTFSFVRYKKWTYLALLIIFCTQNWYFQNFWSIWIWLIFLVETSLTFNIFVPKRPKL